MTDLHELSATDLAAAIRRRDVSSREALDHFLDRVDRLDGPVNAVVTIDARARAGARPTPPTRRRPRGESRGPLHGVPMTIKDSFSTAGMRTTSGAPELSDHVPDEDAAPVAALRGGRRGHLRQDEPADLCRRPPELQRGLRHDQQPVRPRAHARRLLGRVGGRAGVPVHAARARLATSAARSGCRRTCRACTAHKPSYGIVPAHGQIPGPPGTLTQADLAVGRSDGAARSPTSSSASICWPGPTAGTCRRGGSSCRRRAPTDARRLRVAAWLDDPRCPVDAEVATLLARRRRRPRRSGRRRRPRRHARLHADQGGASASTRCCKPRWPAATARPDRASSPPTTATTGVAGHAAQTGMRHREWLSANERRLQMRRRFEAVLRPTGTCSCCRSCRAPAIRHDHSEPIAARTVAINGAAAAVLGSGHVDGTGRRVLPAGHRRARSASPRPGCPSASRSSGRTCATARRSPFSPPPPSPSSAPAPTPPGFE